MALVQKLADTYKVGGLLKESLFAEDNFPAVIDAYKGGRLGMLLAPPTAMQRIRGDAKDIYAITDVAPAPLGPTGIADGGWLVHFADSERRAGAPAAGGRQVRALPDRTTTTSWPSRARPACFPPPSRRRPIRFSSPRRRTPARPRKRWPPAPCRWRHSRTLYVAGIDDYDELRRSLVKAVEAGVTGKQDVQQALDQAVAIWNRKLATLPRH